MKKRHLKSMKIIIVTFQYQVQRKTHSCERISSTIGLNIVVRMNRTSLIFIVFAQMIPKINTAGLMNFINPPAFWVLVNREKNKNKIIQNVTNFISNIIRVGKLKLCALIFEMQLCYSYNKYCKIVKKQSQKY